MTQEYWAAKIRAVIEEARSDGVYVFQNNDNLYAAHQTNDVADPDSFIIDVCI